MCADPSSWARRERRMSKTKKITALTAGLIATVAPLALQAQDILPFPPKKSGFLHRSALSTISAQAAKEIRSH